MIRIPSGDGAIDAQPQCTESDQIRRNTTSGQQQTDSLTTHLHANSSSRCFGKTCLSATHSSHAVFTVVFFVLSALAKLFSLVFGQGISAIFARSHYTINAIAECVRVCVCARTSICFELVCFDWVLFYSITSVSPVFDTSIFFSIVYGLGGQVDFVTRDCFIDSFHRVALEIL